MVYRGINKIENLEKYVSLKTLWVKYRNIKKLNGLDG